MLARRLAATLGLLILLAAVVCTAGVPPSGDNVVSEEEADSQDGCVLRAVRPARLSAPPGCCRCIGGPVC